MINVAGVKASELKFPEHCWATSIFGLLPVQLTEAVKVTQPFARPQRALRSPSDGIGADYWEQAPEKTLTLVGFSPCTFVTEDLRNA